MKKSLYGFLSVFFAMICLIAEAQIQTPQASAKASASTTVGLTDVSIDYWRPKMRGRKIYGADGLVPYGELWRTGANNGTVITFSDDVKVAGTTVKKGNYMLLSIPGEAEWTLILYSDPSIGGNMAGYDKAKDAVRVNVKPASVNPAV
ncbi:MAG TPA: DUF2911 domain-containing protein, partial [Cyclobacteriaceae bacterium]|nr:DUF2911 domain-containing protein [Cyclobacteriaceae bacterium]